MRFIGVVLIVVMSLVWFVCAQDIQGEGITTITGKLDSELDIFDEIQKDIIFYQNSGGGVTFSGGEPSLQPAFLLDMLRECKKETIHTAVDTSGFVRWQVLRKIADYVDLFLYDIKHMNSRKHIEYTGVSNKPILENLRNTR